MPTFIYRANDLAECARQIITESKRPLVAVAFWGTGITEHLGLSSEKPVKKPKTNFDELKLIVNLAAGGTNASVIKNLRSETKSLEQRGVRLFLKQCDKLHAKVWIGDNRALVSSANSSIYGLCFEGSDAGCWNEAGVVVDDVETVTTIRQWFELLWRDDNECKDIKERDLRKVPHRGPPAPPTIKTKRPLSEIYRNDVCPIRLTLFCGENTKAADALAARQIAKLKRAVFNPTKLDNLLHFEIRQGDVMTRWRPNDFGVGVTFDIDVKFTDFAPLNAKFRRIVSVEPVFYQEPSGDILEVLIPKGKKTRPIQQRSATERFLALKKTSRGVR
jgi:hypothetical protein